MSACVLRALSCGAAFVLLVASVPILHGQTTYYVDGSCGDDAWAGASPTCQAPDGPKATIQAGIDAAVNGDTVIVADGTYTGSGNKNLDFAGKAITVRSANGPQNCIIDCENDGRGFYFHNGETADAVLEGFTIRNGFVEFTDGGAILCVSASPTILNCVLSNNQAMALGGGMYNDVSSPTVTDCTFSRNSAYSGGGMFNGFSSSPTVTNCTFTNNTAGSYGGGMRSFASPTVTNCTFAGNSAVLIGGGMDLEHGSPTVTNCTFSGNSAGGWGGGMFNYNSSSTVTNCTFSGNSADSGGGMFNDGFKSSSPTVTNCTFSGNSAGSSGGGMYNVYGNSSPTLTNCILWNDTPDEIVDVNGAVTTVSFSDVQGGWPGQGNIDADPLFVDPANADYRLAPGSPCIDAGDPSFPAPGGKDLGGLMRVWNRRVDIGCHEFGSYVFGDLNCDGAFNGGDIDPFFLALGDPTAYAIAFPNCDPLLGDMNGDGRLDGADIDPFFACLGGNCP